MNGWMDKVEVEQCRTGGLVKSEHREYRELRTGRKVLVIVGSLFVVLESLRIFLRVTGRHLIV